MSEKKNYFSKISAILNSFFFFFFSQKRRLIIASEMCNTKLILEAVFDVFELISYQIQVVYSK